MNASELVSPGRPFLTAEWRHLAMLNYEVDPAVLFPFVPAGTQLDSWDGKHLVSVVGFLFLDTRVCGVRIPFHTDFEEVNLRFYVRRQSAYGWRRGVVFLRELVPRFAIAATARFLYNEKYSAVRMGHSVATSGGTSAAESVSYRWTFRARQNEIRVTATGDPSLIVSGAEQEFIAEHFWGYSMQRDGGTIEYKVDHPRWAVRSVSESRLDVDVAALYGRPFEPFLQKPPSSALLAAGSEVAVYAGERLPK
jgi:uncharacterized protein YqjF (DUF2071 family)